MDEARSVEPDRPRASSPGDGRMRLLDDNPTSQDRLGFSRTADLISQVITEADSLPLTVGVFGGWGTGKTSLMQMVQERLHRRKVKTVWFNAWKYDGKEVIWNAFLQTILLKMRGDGPAGGEASRKAFRERVADTARSLARYSAKVGTRFIPGGIVREEDVDALLDILGSSADSRLFEFINRFETEFDQLVREYVGDSGYLVIFIDDLDRCLPENAIQVLEALKLYLDRTNCVFVVGSEPAVIEEAIRRRYADNPVLSAEEYLEKIVQIPFFVPRVRVRDALLPLAGDIFTREETKQMELLVRVGTRRNPRRVKRFLNAFMIALEDAGPVTAEDRLSLAKVLLSQLYFPQFHRRLMIDPGLFEKLSRADSAVWEREGMGEMYGDFDLRRFLERTRDICPNRRAVRRWIRVEESRSAPQDDAEDGSDDDRRVDPC